MMKQNEATTMKRHMGMKAMSRVSNTFIYLILVIISVIWLVPFVCIVIQSFRVQPTGMTRYLFNNPEAALKEGLAIKFGFDNYVRLFTQTEFPRWYLNTFIISMIILYQVLKDLGLALENAVPGLILVYVASSGMGYYVSKGFFDTIPKSLDEAARIDGATRAQVLFKIILPLAKPIVIYTILTAFMAPWGDFVFAKYISNGRIGAYNVAVGLQSWLATTTMAMNNYTMFCAGGVIVAIPVVILFMCLQRYYVEGVTGGAVKG